MTPSTFVLQPVTTHLPDFLNNDNPELRKKARDSWWSCFERMTQALRSAAGIVFASQPAKLLPYQFSVTENEIRTGLLSLSQPVRNDMCIWYVFVNPGPYYILHIHKSKYI